MFLVWTIITGCLFFWGSMLLVKSVTEEPEVKVGRIQRAVALVLFLCAAAAILVYST